MRGLGLISLAIVLSFSPAIATADESGFQLTPFVGYRMGGDIDAEDDNLDIELDDSVSAGLLLNWHYRDNTEWEIHYSRQDSRAIIRDSSSGETDRVNFDAHMAQLGGTYLFDGETLVPYLAMTLGGTYVRTRGGNSESDTFFSGSLGLGVRYFPNSRVGMRLEARAYGTLISSSTNIFCESDTAGAECAVRLRGDVAGQIETFAGVVIRF
ncbi:MAG: outer membrane beta-barrel protein [Pseudomonadota bacterium]